MLSCKTGHVIYFWSKYHTLDKRFFLHNFFIPFKLYHICTKISRYLNDVTTVHNAHMGYIYEPGHKKMCLMSYANNKGVDQPAHPRNLISAFVVCCLDSIISLDSIAEISRLASFCGCGGRFVSGLVGNSRRHVLSCRGSYGFEFYYTPKSLSKL